MVLVALSCIPGGPAFSEVVVRSVVDKCRSIAANAPLWCRIAEHRRRIPNTDDCTHCSEPPEGYEAPTLHVMGDPTLVESHKSIIDPAGNLIKGHFIATE